MAVAILYIISIFCLLTPIEMFIYVQPSKVRPGFTTELNITCSTTDNIPLLTGPVKYLVLSKMASNGSQFNDFLSLDLENFKLNKNIKVRDSVVEYGRRHVSLIVFYPTHRDVGTYKCSELNHIKSHAPKKSKAKVLLVKTKVSSLVAEIRRLTKTASCESCLKKDLEKICRAFRNSSWQGESMVTATVTGNTQKNKKTKQKPTEGGSDKPVNKKENTEHSKSANDKACNADQFQCSNGQCVKNEDVCDAFPDCEDNSDEDPILCISTFQTVPPVCPADYNRCDDGTCLERCEGPMTCSSEQFRCNDEVDCFPNAMKCDGMPDCSDGADEIGCGLYITGPAVTLVGERIRLVCNVTDRLAVSRYIHWYKDGTVNISALIGITNNRIWTRNYNQKDSRHSISELHILKSEMSDSGVYTCATDLKVSTGYTLIVVTKETTCNPALFTCANGQCLDYFSVCDGSNDCGDNSDENICPDCGEGEFKCANNACINNIRRCDGSDDCGDNSDEVDCRPMNCSSDHFRCSDGENCIPNRWKCDGVTDCTDADDEIDCVCDFGEFQCANKACINYIQLCNGSDDCGDNSDEDDCSNL